MNRYSMKRCHFYLSAWCLEETEDGQWVRWEDVEALQRERDEARALLRQILSEEVVLHPVVFPFHSFTPPPARRSFEVPNDICTRAEKVVKRDGSTTVP